MESDATVTSTDPAGSGLPTVMVFWPGGAVARTLSPGVSLTLGRDPTSDVVIGDPSVSRAHVRVECVALDALIVEDLESSNGAFVGPSRVGARRPVRVAAGEEVRFGVARLVLFAPRAPAAGASREEGERRPLETVRAFAKRVARGDISVLILGETGVGKDLMAELVHRESLRAERPLLRLNCAAVPDALLESELFGHERGAFTGATGTKVGLLEAAAGGTVLLDEIGDISVSAQSKLLRALENREIFRVGSTTPRPIDVRFIAATSRDLGALIASGAFRPDVYYRLSAAVLRIPPLRERREEILPLATRFLGDAAARLGAAPPRIAGDAARALVAYDWPGNVRELKNAMERAALVCDASELAPEHLELAPASSRPGREASPAESSLHSEIEVLERKRIVEALERCAGNQTRAAKLLGVSRRTLVKRLDAYGIARPKKDADGSG
jgi:DNA-binding NtrC family response regulator